VTFQIPSEPNAFEFTMSRSALERYRDELTRLRASVMAQRIKSRSAVPGRGGADGLKIARCYSHGIDQIVRCIYSQGARRYHITGPRASDLVLLALGGYGRRDLNLHSDIDLLFLHKGAIDTEQEAFIRYILYCLWDLKLDVGYAIRTLSECLTCVGSDLSSTTALLENRYLIGSQILHRQLNRRLATAVRKHKKRWFVSARLEEWHARHEKFGASIYLLEPNVKEGEGGLRDIHTIQWLGYAVLGDRSLRGLERRKILTQSERKQLLRAMSVLYLIRNELHHLEGRKADILTFDMQPKVARALGYRADGKRLVEEQLMQDYYRSAREISRICDKAVGILKSKARTGARGRVRRHPQRRLGPWYLAAGDVLFLRDYSPAFVRKHQEILLDIFFRASASGKRVSDATKDFLRTQLAVVDDQFRSDPENRDRFLAILDAPRFVAQTVRDMHETGILAAYIPEFDRIHCLVNIDFYHRYTVDEHLLKALEVSEAIRDRTNHDVPRDIRKVARTIRRWDLLNLALLLHDIGKGEGVGHVLRGGQISQRITSRMGMTHDDQETVRFLILHHLKMAHVAQRRDLEDAAIIEELCREVGSLSLLRMLYVITYCDLSGIGPDIWTDWKGQLLYELYNKAALVLQGSSLRESMRFQVNPHLVQDVAKCLTLKPRSLRALDQFLKNTPERYQIFTPPSKIAQQFEMLDELDEETRIIWRLHQPEGARYTELLVCAVDVPGLFSKMCGALSSKELNILTAQIFSTKDGFAIDTFQFTDLEGKPLPEGFRLERVRYHLNLVLLGKKRMDDLLEKRRPPKPLDPDRLALFPTTIEFNNEDSKGHTIIEIKTLDRPWLLYTITSILAQEGVNIDLALISTEAYRVVDVFYVTDLENNKIDNPHEINRIQTLLKNALTPEGKAIH
jgi:[protein-PII] uridylyltransferase